MGKVWVLRSWLAGSPCRRWQGGRGQQSCPAVSVGCLWWSKEWFQSLPTQSALGQATGLLQWLESMFSALCCGSEDNIPPSNTARKIIPPESTKRAVLDYLPDACWCQDLLSGSVVLLVLVHLWCETVSLLWHCLPVYIYVCFLLVKGKTLLRFLFNGWWRWLRK